LLHHAKLTTTLDLYSQSIDAAKLEAQEDVAMAVKSAAAAGKSLTKVELKVTSGQGCGSGAVN
jgi:hypothetical protein